MTALAIHPPGSAGAIVRQLFHHAWPILIAQLLSMAMMIADTLIAGRYGTLDLAGVAIGSSFYISVVMLLGGILQAVAPTVAHHVGAGRHAEIGPALQQGFWLAAMLALGIVAVYALAPRVAADEDGGLLAEWRQDIDRGRLWLHDRIIGE